MTLAVEASIDSIDVTASWGRYSRAASKSKTTKESRDPCITNLAVERSTFAQRRTA